MKVFNGLSQSNLIEMLRLYEKNVCVNQAILERYENAFQMWECVDLNKLPDCNEKVQLKTIKELEIGIYKAAEFLINEQNRRISEIEELLNSE